jgi:hypothetical protein
MWQALDAAGIPQSRNGDRLMIRGNRELVAGSFNIEASHLVNN